MSKMLVLMICDWRRLLLLMFVHRLCSVVAPCGVAAAFVAFVVVKNVPISQLLLIFPLALPMFRRVWSQGLQVAWLAVNTSVCE